jgi:6-phosphogluconolactonase
MKNLEVIHFASNVELADTAAKDWLNLIAGPPAAHLVALAGGRIASLFFDAVTEHAVASSVSFEHVHFFWSDERCVPPDHPDSNFRVAEKELLGPLGIAADRIHRIKGELKPADAVTEADAAIGLVAPLNSAGLPVLDLVLLGMGEDGHVASLFPNAPASVVECQTPFVAVRSSSKPPPLRISMSYAAMAAARQVWVLVDGAHKEEALLNSLRPGGGTPLARIARSRRQVRIFTDIVTEPSTQPPVAKKT